MSTDAFVPIRVNESSIIIDELWTDVPISMYLYIDIYPIYSYYVSIALKTRKSFCFSSTF